MTEKVKHPLHELLAVLSDLEGTAKKVRDEGINTFTKKQSHFNGYEKTLKMYSDERKQEETGARESKDLVTTVEKKLKYISKSQVKYYDALLQQEATNQKAVADLVVEGKTIAENLPATFLLGMESRLKAFRAVLENIPTLDPSLSWKIDVEAGEGIYVTEQTDTSYKQEKTVQHKVIVPATKEHPAQIREWADNKNVGTFFVTRRSSCISPAEKSKLLEKTDTLIRAVKKARQRANSTEIEKRSIGKDLMDFIFEG